MTVISTNAIGKPVSRVDGPAKVTGAAKYAAEFNEPNLAYGFVVSSAIAKGRIKSIDRTAALAVPGVIEVFAHDNRPSVAPRTRNIRTRQPRRARHSDRFTTTPSCSAVSRLRSSWRKSSRSRALRRRWSTSSTRRWMRSPISTRKSTKPTTLGKSEWSQWPPRLRAAMPIRLCPNRRSAKRRNIARRWSTIIPWSASAARRFGTKTNA